VRSDNRSGDQIPDDQREPQSLANPAHGPRNDQDHRQVSNKFKATHARRIVIDLQRAS
jgi:hypothetical protein